MTPFQQASLDLKQNMVRDEPDCPQNDQAGIEVGAAEVALREEDVPPEPGQ